MDFSVSFNSIDEQSIPLVFINGRQLHLVTYSHHWATKTDILFDGLNIIIVAGYLEGSTDLRQFRINLENRKVTEL